MSGPYPIDTAPCDGTRILVYAEHASDRAGNAFNGLVIVAWVNGDWQLSPYVPGTRIDSEA